MLFFSDSIEGSCAVKRDYSRILVTGGAGFIGSHLVDRLLTEGYEVTVLDNLSSGHLKNIAHERKKTFHFIKGDIRNSYVVKNALKDVDAVFHEAAFVSITQSVKKPIVNNAVNVAGTLNMLRASLRLGVKRFVFASSAAVYGKTRTPVQREDMMASPESPYAASKLAAENYVRLYCKIYGLETVSLRFFNVYGPRQRFDIDCAYGGVIPIFLGRVLKDLPPLIFGDGRQTRDFVYIKDVVESKMLALSSKRATGEVINIGTGIGVSVNHIATSLKRLVHKENLRNLHSDTRPGEIRHSRADINKAKRILGYTPTFSLEQGLGELVEWFKHGHGYGFANT